MELKNQELFSELDNILLNLSEEAIASNTELQQYYEFSNNVEAGDIPYEEYEKYDNAEKLNNLINIAKEL